MDGFWVSQRKKEILCILTLGSVRLSPPVFLAPLAGITDLPFRNLVSRFGAGLVVSEMVASQEMVQNKPAARERAELGVWFPKYLGQIAGRDAFWIAEAAKLIADNGAGIIDINMGCPRKRSQAGIQGQP